MQVHPTGMAADPSPSRGDGNLIPPILRRRAIDARPSRGHVMQVHPAGMAPDASPSRGDGTRGQYISQGWHLRRRRCSEPEAM